MKQLTFPKGLSARRQRARSIPAGDQTPERSRAKQVLTLSAALTLGFVLVITLTRLVMTAVHPGGFVSALTPYQSIQPGITLDAIRPFACGVHYFSYETREENCDLTQVGLRLRRVTLTLQGSRVSKVTFSGNGIQVADLVQVWGRPDTIVKENGLFNARWESGIQAIMPGEHGFSFHLPVTLVVLS